MKVLVCGSRDWDDEQVVWTTLRGYQHEFFGRLVVIEGGARGADECAAEWCDLYEDEVEHVQVKADWKKYGKAAGPIRNQHMLTLEPDVVIAFKDGFDWSLQRGGTEDMVRRALRDGIRTYVIGQPKVSDTRRGVAPGVSPEVSHLGESLVVEDLSTVTVWNRDWDFNSPAHYGVPVAFFPEARPGDRIRLIDHDPSCGFGVFRIVGRGRRDERTWDVEAVAFTYWTDTPGGEDGEP